MSTEIAKRQTVELAATPDRESYALDVSRVVAQTMAVQQCMATVMVDGEHYGVIPGTQKPGEKPKKTLLQPGADKLCLMFRLRPEYEVITRTERDDFIAREVRCRLYHIQTGECWGEGIGSANSREARYKNQATAKVCPKCGKPAIIRGKPEFGGGWLCYQKKDGCGAKFQDGDMKIEAQEGQVNSDKLWDLHNTITKMANKRAKVAAVLTATAASDIFTQDLEDLEDLTFGQKPAEQKPATRQAQSQAKPQAQTVDAEVVQPSKPSPQPADLPKASKEQVTALCTVMTKIGIKERQAVLAWINERIAPRTVDSRIDLTPDEAKNLIDLAETTFNDSKKE